MRWIRGRWRLTVCLLVCTVAFSGLATAAPGGGNGGRDPLEVYTLVVDAGQAAELARQGYDIIASRQAGEKMEVDVILSEKERNALASRGVQLALKKTKSGKTPKQLATEQAASGYTVWRSYDQPGGIRDQMYDLARRDPQLVKLVVIGRTIQGREIIALKLTQAANQIPDATRPAVLYMSNQHAREWISVEVNRRLLKYYIAQWHANNKAIRRLLKERELWFILSANPDGYQYTFDVERLWRKNLRDNDADGQITNMDGVDPNRNYPDHWNYDNEGASSQASNQRYRGAAPASEPETQAVMGLMNRIPFKMVVNYHSFGQLLLYPVGWQMGTAPADDPIYIALSGTDAKPAIEGFDPGNAADELYVTNGETTDFASSSAGALTWTPELGEGQPGAGFVFPDDEALVQAEFQRGLNFALDIAKSAANPAEPVSHLGNTMKPFYLELASLDPEKTLSDKGDFRFDVSYGDPQPVRVLARRNLGPVAVKYQINNGSVQSALTAEWQGGERFGQEGAIYYHVLQGHVTGTSPGDSVRVWFEGGGTRSDSFTYTAVEESNDEVLVLAAEDYSGASPVYPAGAGPIYLSYYTDALTANDVRYDVYDVDARGRTAPDSLGVLSHYKAVIWYTGDDVITREIGWGPGTASRLANDEILEVRSFLNEGGRLLYTGKWAGHQYTLAHGAQRFDPVANQQCSLPEEPRCLSLSGSGDGTNDFLEYWLGAYILNDNAGQDPVTGNLYQVNGVAEPLQGLSWTFNGPDSAQNQVHSASFIVTSALLPPSAYPQFTSLAAAKYDRSGGPFEPPTGQHYMYSQIADVSYKRLARTITVPAGGAILSFWVSHDTEARWDHTFVEAHTVGLDDWTTLPDLNGHTTQDTGDACPAGWRNLHPHLDHYQTLHADGTCSPSGTTGAWHAASGNSGGWQQWSVDLAPYAGKQVEVSLAYVSDWAVQGLGTFVDDIDVSTGEGSTSFESGMDGWLIAGPPPGSAPNGNNFVRTTSAGFQEGAVVTTPNSIYWGFGFEGISGAGARTSIMGRAIEYLLR